MVYVKMNMREEHTVQAIPMIENPIKVLFSDVDGTLTDGALQYGTLGEIMKVFHVKDGMGIKNWMSCGFIFGVITARTSEITALRMKELGVLNVIIGAEDKKSLMERWLSENNFSWENLAYIGDDINDLPVLSLAGFSAAPADAVDKVTHSVRFKCKTCGGRGAVREFIDFLLDDIRPT